VVVSADRRLQVVAARQLGLFTLGQARPAGFTYGRVRRRLDCGQWEQVAPSVLRARPAAALDWRQAALAACLAHGGVAGFRTAAALYGLGRPPAVPEVLVRRTRRRGPLPAGVHSSGDLPETDCTLIGAVPATTPARTLIDACGVVSRRVAAGMVETAIVRRLVHPARLARRARELQAPRRRGCAVVLRILDALHPDLAEARNAWEARLLRVFRTAGLPDPVPNFPVVVGGRRRLLDAAWPDLRIFAEFDGYEPHAGRDTFDDDRRRQNDLVEEGWRPFRFTATDVAGRSLRAFTPLVRAVRRASAGPRSPTVPRRPER
jgi:hypothetical protein